MKNIRLQTLYVTLSDVNKQFFHSVLRLIIENLTYEVEHMSHRLHTKIHS